MRAAVMAPVVPVADPSVSVASLTGAQKVAVLFMSLGAEKTAAVRERLSPEEIQIIDHEVPRLGMITEEVVEAVLEEWFHTTRAAESLADGGIDFARKILEKQFGPQRALQILKRINEQITEHVGPERLRVSSPQPLGTMLRNEHPQTIALVLAHLNPLQTAAFLKELTPKAGVEILYRMACLEEVSPEMLPLIESELDTEIAPYLRDSLMISGGPAGVAAVLNSLPRLRARELFAGLALWDLVVCEEIRALMFTFEDLVMLDMDSLQRLLQEIDSSELALALHGASEEVRGVIFAAMAPPAAAALEHDLEMIHGARMCDSEAAQGEILLQLRRLEESGELVVASRGESDDVRVG